jgi:adenylyl- and sulfurtransferase ThiI
MKEILLLKDGEIVLKGLNRRSFEDVLKKNLKHALKSAGHFEITSAQSTIYVKPLMMTQILKRLAKSFQGCSELSLFQEPPFVKKQSNPFLKPLRNILKISLKI